MSRVWIWIAVAVACAGLIIGAAILVPHLQEQTDSNSGKLIPATTTAPAETQESQEQTEESANLAPDFTVYDANGEAVKLSDLRGQPVVVNLWASWCGPCKSEMPGFDNICQMYQGKVAFMMINVTGIDTLADAKKYISDNGYIFPVYYDTDNSMAANYYSGSVPMTYFINSKGECVTYAVGAIDEATLEQGIGMIKD